MKMINNFLKDSENTFRGAIFMSGSGSNAEKILEYTSAIPQKSWIPAAIVTDRPETSRAFEIASKFDLPVVELDIKKFYNERGEKRISIMTEKGREIREQWTDTLREKLVPFSVDFGILAGFVPLTNITNDFPCLNVHPGDLTVEKDGQRLLIGLHTIPIETAIIEGFESLRSSVIVAQSYTGGGSEMDTGPILGISTPVKIDFCGNSLEALFDCAKKRPESRPVGGYKDLLEDVAKKNQENLKEGGDWVVFPPVIEDFASGNYGIDEAQNLFLKEDGNWKPISTIEFGEDSRKPFYMD